MKQITRLAAAILIAVLPPTLLSACSAPTASSAAPPLEGARIGGPFALIDQNGAKVTDQNFVGKYRIMYFGYTFCPDVCPVDVQNIGAGLRAFEAQDAAAAAKVVPIFVSIDPDRDTPAVLKQFVTSFHPRMVGLTGSPEEIAKVAKDYAIFYAKGATSPGGGYLMDHARISYLMDPDGKPIALLPHDGTPQAFAAELKRWVR